MKRLIAFVTVVLSIHAISMSSHAAVEAIAVGLTGTNTYVVPLEKTLIIEYIFCYIDNPAEGYPGYSTTVCFTPPNGTQDFLVDAFSADSTNSTLSYRMAMKFPAGTAIKCWGDADTLAFTGLLVDSYDLYAGRGKIDDVLIDNNMISMNVSGPPGQHSKVSIESTYDLLGAEWRREQEAHLTQTSKGSSEFGVEVPITSANQSFYRARFRPKE